MFNVHDWVTICPLWFCYIQLLNNRRTCALTCGLYMHCALFYCCLLNIRLMHGHARWVVDRGQCLSDPLPTLSGLATAKTTSSRRRPNQCINAKLFEVALASVALKLA